MQSAGVRRVRFWDNLGSASAVRIIFVAMIVYFLVIGGLVLGYIRVQDCLQTYSDESAQSTRIRLQAASDDRALNARVAAVDNSDRSRIIANQKATRDLISSVIGNGTAPDSALLAYKKVSDDSLDIFAINDGERKKIDQERARIDATRATAPAPAPPSETC